MMPTSPRNHGAPVPSTMRPFSITTSNAVAAGDAGEAGDEGDAHAADRHTTHATRAIGFIGIRESYVESPIDVESLARCRVPHHRAGAVCDSRRAGSNGHAVRRGAVRHAAALAGVARVHLPRGDAPHRHRPPQRAVADDDAAQSPAAGRAGIAVVLAGRAAGALPAVAARSTPGPAGTGGSTRCDRLAVGGGAASMGVVAIATRHRTRG